MTAGRRSLPEGVRSTEGLDDTGAPDAPAQSAQMQALPCVGSGTDARSSAVNEARAHQQADSLAAAGAMAHRFGPPHSGQDVQHVADAFASMATALWHSPPA